MSSRSNIRNMENELNNLYYKLGSDIIEQIDSIDVNFIPTDDLLDGYDYFKETSDTPLDDYILYVLENGSIDDILKLCKQIINSLTKYLLDKKDIDAVYHYKLEDQSTDTWTKSDIIDYLLWGVICDSNFSEEQLNFFTKQIYIRD